MGINLGNMEANNNTQQGVQTTMTPPVMPQQAPMQRMSLNLKKNDVLDLTKRNPGLRQINLAAGWDVSQIGGTFDLDIAALVLKNGKVQSASDVVYFNNMAIPGVRLNGDNRTGEGDGDDEVISLDLAAINPNVTKIVFVVTIYDAMTRRQNFGMVENSYVRLVDVSNGERELCIYKLKENYSTSTAVVAAELVRNGADWDFHALGDGMNADLGQVAGQYM